MPLQLSPFVSLRFRLLIPILAAAAAIALVVAVMSFLAGRQWAHKELETRRASVERTLRDATYPLTPPVASALSALSGADLVVFDESYEPTTSTIALDATSMTELRTKMRQGNQSAFRSSLDGNHYWVSVVKLNRSPTGREREVALLMDEASVREAGQRAAMLPLITGLTTITLLCTVVMFSATRLVSRIARLQETVREVALGHFETTVKDESQDELGRLGRDVNDMGAQLKGLWSQVNRQQRERLLHQLSAGMAHQLRNTLTGARLALELHLNELESAVVSKLARPANPSPDELVIVDRELTRAEEFVQRLLMVGTEERRTHDRPMPVDLCLNDLRASHDIIARHLSVDIAWGGPEEVANYTVADGPTFVAAISNLILNAIDAGKVVEVECHLQSASMCMIRVSDDGPGVLADLEETIFEPLVTSKPEGLGLGLALVRRAASKLGGTVSWSRREGVTTFEFSFAVVPTRN